MMFENLYQTNAVESKCVCTQVFDYKKTNKRVVNLITKTTVVGCWEQTLSCSKTNIFLIIGSIILLIKIMRTKI